MKIIICLLVAMSFVYFGCNSEKKNLYANGTNYKSQVSHVTKLITYFDGNVSFQIPDDEMILYELDKRLKSTKYDAVKIVVNGFDFEILKDFESESYSEELMKIFYQESESKYEQVLNYLKSSDFENNKAVMFAQRKIKKDFIKESHDKIVYDGKIIGEQVLRLSDTRFPFSITYYFLFVINGKLVDSYITILSAGEDISMLQEFFEAKDENYYWKSEDARMKFYNLLESDNYTKLPRNIQLLRETKDLFLNTLSIVQ